MLKTRRPPSARRVTISSGRIGARAPSRRGSRTRGGASRACSRSRRPRARDRPRLLSRRQQDDEGKYAGSLPSLGGYSVRRDAVSRVLGHPEARVLHDLGLLREELDLGIRSLVERRCGVRVGPVVEDRDRVVEPSGAKETRGGDARDDSDGQRSARPTRSGSPRSDSCRIVRAAPTAPPASSARVTQGSRLAAFRACGSSVVSASSWDAELASRPTGSCRDVGAPTSRSSTSSRLRLPAVATSSCARSSVSSIVADSRSS